MRPDSLIDIQEFRLREPIAFRSDFSVYAAARSIPKFPAVRIGRRLFIDIARWEEFKRTGGASFAGGWRKESA